MGEVLLFLVFAAGVIWMFRKPKKKVHYGQTFEDTQPPSKVRRRDLDNNEGAPKEMTPGARLGLILVLSVWLSFWTFGCFMALTTAAELSYGQEGFIFLHIWLALAIPAWFFVAWTLFRLFRGDNVGISFDGDADGDGGGD